MVGQAILPFQKDAVSICWLVPEGSETYVSSLLLLDARNAASKPCCLLSISVLTALLATLKHSGKNDMLQHNKSHSVKHLKHLSHLLNMPLTTLHIHFQTFPVLISSNTSEFLMATQKSRWILNGYTMSLHVHQYLINSYLTISYLDYS